VFSVQAGEGTPDGGVADIASCAGVSSAPRRSPCKLTASSTASAAKSWYVLAVARLDARHELECSESESRQIS